MYLQEGTQLRRSAVCRNGALAVLAILCCIAPLLTRGQETDAAKRASLQQQLDALEKEAAALDQQIAQTEQEANTLQQQIKIFNDEIKQRQLEIKRLNLAVSQADLDIKAKTQAIAVLTNRIAKNRATLGENIAELRSYDEENMIVVLAKNSTLSDFFTSLDNIRSLQDQVGQLVKDLRDARTENEQQKSDLEDYRQEQLSLRALAEVERRAVEEKKQQKNQLLALTKGKEALYQQLLAKKKQDIAALKTQLFYIEKTGISAEDALHYAQLASQRAGIRTAFLLALLEVETGKQFEGGVITAGTHLGTGNWKTDLYNCYIQLGRRSAAENQKNAFLQITSALGLDPDQMPVSKKPSYGCGGAMGPAQFLPTTWLLFADRVATLTGHNPPNPWNIEDAFTASAVFLADAGASSQTRAGELAAARTYISGRSTCPASGSARYACIAYGNRVISLAEDIDKVI